MKDIYRVIVLRNGGMMGGGEVLFEAAGQDIERLLAYAPDEVAAALRDLLPDEDEGDVPAVNPEGHYRPLNEPATPAAPKTRKRRTKAEIAADKARAAAGGSAFGEQVVADTEAARPSPQALDEPAPQAPPAETVQPAAPVAAPEPVPAAVSVPPATDGAPWNPFQQR